MPELLRVVDMGVTGVDKKTVQSHRIDETISIRSHDADEIPKQQQTVTNHRCILVINGTTTATAIAVIEKQQQY